MINRREKNLEINHAPVESSSVKTIGYDKEKQELHVTFRGSGRYVYQNVPSYVYESLMMAGSKGNFIHHNLKNRYEFNKI